MAGEILTEMVECPVTDSPAVPGYLARPEGDGPFPAIVVIQEWWGLEPHIKDIAERFAREGYAALAPDLYHGAVTDEPDEARKLAMETDMDLAVREVGGAVTYLRGQPYAKGTVATIGYCMGGGLSLSASCRYPVDATIVYYGGNPNPAGAGPGHTRRGPGHLRRRRSSLPGRGQCPERGADQLWQERGDSHLPGRPPRILQR